MKKIVFFILFIFFVFNFSSVNILTSNADELENTVNEQLGRIDFTDIEEHFDNLNIEDYNFYSLVQNLIKGENNLNFSSVFEYVFDCFTVNIQNSLPSFLTIISICIFCALVGEFKSSFLEDSISKTIFFVCYLCMLTLISLEIITLYKNTVLIIKNITKTCEIMSPIILTLMITSGQNSSANLFSPVVVFLSSGILNLFCTIILPLVVIYGVFSVVNNLNSDAKLNRFIDFFSSLIKWILGITVTLFGVYLTVSGISSGKFDSVSIKLANYAISNSVPIVGSFVKDGFNVVLAGSYLIKNAVGISGIIGLVYLILSPVLNMLAYSFLLKFTSSVIEPFNLQNVSSLCQSACKFITYLIISILMVGIMVFITIMLMLYSSAI